MGPGRVLLTIRPALGHDEAPGILPEGDWTEEQAHAAIDLVERTEAALPAFADTERLAELGFFDFGATAPGGSDHWINPGWFDDEHILDPEHPRRWSSGTPRTASASRRRCST